MAKKKGWVAMDKGSIPFGQLRRSFMLRNQTANKSARTIEWYEERLEAFQRFVGADATLADLTLLNAREFIAELQGRTVLNPNNAKLARPGKLSSSYIQGFARALRAFSSWLYEEGYVETNVLRPMKPPKIQQKVIQILTELEIENLLWVFNREDPYGARNYAIVFLMLDAGLRASELLDLRLDDTHIREGFLKVLGKGNKERLIPIGRRCQETLSIWVQRLRPEFAEGSDAPNLFLNQNGQRMTLRSLEELIKKAGEYAKIPNLHPHRLRHTFATRFLTLGLGDTFQLQHFLGHTSLEMVRRYVSAASVEKAIMERRPSAMDRLGEGKMGTGPDS